VAALIEALEGESDAVRSKAISILSLIRDPRALEPIIAQLLDRDYRLREDAAMALARFPLKKSVPALEKALRTDGRHEVRVAALQSLIVLFEAGFDEAIREVITVLFDASHDRRMRHAALAVIPLLRPREQRALLKKLRSDQDPEIARQAVQIEQALERPPRPDEADLRRALGDLASPRGERWNEALQLLVSFGERVIDPLIIEMVRKSRDAEYCARAGMVLRGLGARRLRPIVDYLERLEDPLPLEVIVEVVGMLEDKPLIYKLKDLIERLKARGETASEGETPDEMHRVRAKAHLQLARIGSRVAIDDMKETLSAPGIRIGLDLLAAVELIGKPDELLDLMRAYRKEDPWMRDQIRKVFLGIMRRERIRRTNRIFSSLSTGDRRTLDSILGPPEGRSGQPAHSVAAVHPVRLVRPSSR